MSRIDARHAHEIRKVKITRNFLPHTHGSAFIEMGDTKVICTASYEAKVPAWMKGSGKGWITAEYAMIPGSSPQRVHRESSKGKVSGRTHEIQRLIGRSLRAVVDTEALPELTLWVDCDVISADGGTRCASITGAYVAMFDAFEKLTSMDVIPKNPITDHVAAISLGILDQEVLIDLNYHEDSRVDVDMNLVMTGSGKFIEVQGTAEREPFGRELLTEMIQMGEKAITELIEVQKATLGS